jgi:hypothetical protein
MHAFCMGARSSNSASSLAARQRELDRGSFSIAREWTDWADPSPNCSLGLPPRRLDADSLFQVRRFDLADRF